MSEDRVRDLMRAAVDDVRPSTEAGEGWADVQARAAAADVRRARRFRLGLLAAAALTVAVGAVAVLSDDDTPGTHVVTPAGPTTSGPEVPTTSAPPTAGAGFPAFFVGTRDHSSTLVVARTATGATDRVLATMPANRVIQSLALSPDGAYAYFSTGPEPISGQLHRVRVAGGPVEELGDGSDPAVSPDGARLAYALMNELVVRDLATGREARHGDTAAAAYVAEPVWTADGRSVVFQKAVDGSPPSWYAIAASLAGAPRRIGPSADAGHQNDMWWSPAAGAGGRIGFLESCCAQGPAPRTEQPVRLVLVDPATGAVKDRRPLAAAARHVDLDATGAHELYVVDGGLVYRRSGGPLVPVGSNFDLAAW